ncbi:MAG: TonB-dependent receptor [Acidobacteria bacterium]|nr:TonB-dependent receptor [Acidobacteriota bacterium]MBI3488164.1 TonB-dependent receptor [Acidobacteriota bacterium]
MLSTIRNLGTGRLCALIVASSGWLYAQSNPTGSLSGTVKGPGGAPVAGALLQYDSGRGIHETRTNENGQFLLPQLIPGAAKLKVHAPGMMDVVLQPVVVVNQATQLNIVLTLVAGATVEVISVSTPQAGTEQTTALVGASFDLEALKALPIIGDPLSAVAKMMPGTPSGGFNFHASQDSQNSFQYDGVEARSASQGGQTLQVNRDLIEQIQVLTGGVSTRYGRFVGGMVTTVSKTGGNEFSGSMRHDLTSASWNALPRLSAFTTKSVPVPRHVADQQSWTLMGPILKDTLFFTAGYTIATPGTTTVVNSSLRSGLFAPFSYVAEGHRSTKDFKLDWQINTDNRLTAAWQQYLGTSTQSTSGAGKSSLATTGGPSRDERGYYSLGWLGVLSPTLHVDVKLSQTRTQTGGPGTGSPGGADVVTWIDRSTTGSSDTYDNGTTSSPLNREIIRTAGVNFTWFIANHSVEAGIQDYSSNKVSMGTSAPDAGFAAMSPSRKVIWFNGWTAAPPSMDRQYRLMSVNNNLLSRLILFDPLQGEVNLRVTGLYVNDVWTLSTHWNLNYGVRIDRYHYSSSPEGDSFTPTTFTPRANLDYDLKGDGHHIFGVSLAEYAGLTNTGDFSQASVAGSVPVRLYKYYGAGTGADALNVDGTVNWNVWGSAAGTTGMANPYFQSGNPVGNRKISVDSGIKPPRSREATLSYRYTDQTQSFIATLMHKRQDRYVDDRWDGVPGTAPGAANRVLWNDPGAEARYTGLELQYRRQVTADLSAGGNLTWSSTHANAGQGNNSYRNDFGGLISNDFVAPYGPQPGQWASSTTPFMAHVDGTYRRGFGKFGAMTVSLLGNYYSKSFAGYRTIYGNTPGSITAYGYSPTLARTFTNERLWWPEQYGFDFHLGYDVKVQKKVECFAALDVKNLFNHMQPMYKFYSSVLADGNGTTYTNPAAFPADWWYNPSFRAVGNATGANPDGSVGDFTAPRAIQVKLGVRF